MKRKLICRAFSLFVFCSSSVLMAQGSLCLNDATDYSFLNGGQQPMSVTSADFNKDGFKDIATANNGSNDISVLMGNGNGSFTTAVNYAIPGQGLEIFSADCNNDSNTDLVATDWSGNISVFLNTGSGAFAAPLHIQGYSGMVSAAMADFNKDGNIDFVTVGYWYTYLFAGNGNGNFTLASSFQTGLNPNFLTVGDVNADANPDLIVSSQTDSLYVFLGSGTNAFTVPNSSYFLGSSVQSRRMTLADLDQDGDKDLTVMLYAIDSFAVFKNNGNGTFNPTPSKFLSNYNQGALTAADYNNDGKIDLAVEGTILRVLFNTGGYFPTYHDYYGGTGMCLISTDLNNDNHPDLVNASSQSNNCWILMNNGSGSFNDYTPFSTVIYPKSIIKADLDNDGLNDVMVCSEYDNGLSMLPGKNSGYFGPTNYINLGQAGKVLATADFNGDNNPDVFVAHANNPSYQVLLGNGNGTFVSTATVSLSLHFAYSAQVGDMNNDGAMDVVAGDYNGYLIVLLGQSNGTFQSPIFTLGASTNSSEQLVLADLNKDGKLDVISASTSGTNVHFYPGDGTGHFNTMQSFACGTNPWAVAVADLNNDGNPDIVTGNNNTSNEVSVLLASSAGAFNAPTNYSVNSGNGISFLKVADFNNDTKPDIIACGQYLHALVGNGNGTFGSASKFSMVGQIETIVPMDADHDGKLDIVAGCAAKGILVALNIASPTVTASASANPVCKNASVTLNGHGAATYTWTGGVNDGSPFSANTTTTYTVTGATVSGCSANTVLTLTVNPLPTLTVTATPTLVCYGSPETLSASGANTYTWSSGVTNGAPFYPGTSANYTVSGTDGNGCTNTTYYYATVDQPYIWVTANTHSVCYGQNVVLTGNGANTYTWSSGVTNGIPFTPTTTAVFTVTASDYNNCTASDTVKITVNPLPVVVAHATQGTVCLGNSTTLYGSGASTYTWNNGVSNNIPFTPSNTMGYVITGTDANNCQASDFITIIVNPLPIVTFTSLGFASPVCSNAGAQTITGGAPAGGVYSGPGVVSSTNLFLPVLSPGTYTLSYTYTDANQCSNTAQDTVSVQNCTTGINNVSNTSTPGVFPNPGKGFFNIEGIDAPSDISVLNNLGEIVFDKRMQAGEKEIDLTALPGGLYYLQIRKSDNQVVLKVEIEK